MTSSNRYEFTTSQIVTLLDELDTRLRSRGVAAAIFVVGGAAMAVGNVRANRLTEDVDAVTSHALVIEEARAVAITRGLPITWLNDSARMWMPPLPQGVLDEPGTPGLRVTFADDGFLLATKLVAQRAKDADDVLALARRLGLNAATAVQLEAHIRRYYTDPGALELIIGSPDVDHEISLLASDAERLLRRTGS